MVEIHLYPCPYMWLNGLMCYSVSLDPVLHDYLVIQDKEKGFVGVDFLYWKRVVSRYNKSADFGEFNLRYLSEEDA